MTQKKTLGGLFFKLSAWFVVCLLALFVINSMVSGGGGGGDDSVTPDVPVTNSLLIVYESDPSDPQNAITLQQRFIIDSTKVRQWCADNGVDFKALDKDQVGDLHFIDDKWQSLADAIRGQSLPAWAISFGKTTTAGPLPSSVDEALRKLEGR